MLAFNFLVAVALTLTFAWAGPRPSWSSAREAFVPNLVLSNAIGFTCAMAMPRIVPAVWHFHPVLRWTSIVAALLGINLVGVCAGVGFLIRFYGSRVSYWSAVWDVYRTAAVVTLLIGLFWVIYETWRGRIEQANLEIKNREIERERALKLAASAQLASIESRVHPHFLFNSLNSISSLIQEDPARAEELVERLSRLLRSSLDKQGEALVPLEDELRLVRDYLEIQRARFGDRLRYRIEAGPAPRGTLVPPFAIQTLVENSIKHAIGPKASGGEIVIAVSTDGEHVRLEVADDGPGFDASHIRPGRGLDTLRARLEAHYGGNASLDVHAGGSGSRVSIALPAGAAA
jgi:two-component system LytT family sensor kinase